MGSYADLYNNVNEYYSGVDQWERLNNYDLTASNYYDTVSTSNLYNVKYNNNGDVVAYTYNNTTPNASGGVSQLDSNDEGGGGFTTTEIGTQNTINPSTGKVNSTSVLSSGANFYFNSIKPAIAAAATGISLGKTIDATLYNLNPDFWDSHGMAALNPETWNDITGGDNTGLNYLFNTIFGLDPTGSQMYIQDEAFAYLALWLAQQGFFEGETTGTNEHYGEPDSSDYFFLDSWNPPLTVTSGSAWLKRKYYGSGNDEYMEIVTGNYDYICCMYNVSFDCIAIATHPFIVTVESTNLTTGESIISTVSSNLVSSTSEENKTGVDFYFCTCLRAAYGSSEYIDSSPYNDPGTSLYVYYPTPLASDIYNFTIGGTVHDDSIPGVTDQPGATIPEIDPTWTIQDTDTYLRITYPNIYNMTVTNTVIQPDGTPKEYKYIPVPYPTGGTNDRPTGGDTNQPNQQNPKNTDEDGKNKQADDTSKRTKDRPSGGSNDTGQGETPDNSSAPEPLTSSNLFTLYQVTASQLGQLGAALWNSSIIEQIKQMFTQPMDAFISLKQSFILPGTTSSHNIKLGYYDSGVSAVAVTGNLAYCNCGSVSLKEYFKNAFDYMNVKIRIYLPFYGFANLDVDDVMRSAIGVRYIADLYSGQTLIEVKVMRDGNNNLLYTFECNTSLDIPLTNGNYSSMLAGFLSVAGGAMAGGAAVLSGASAGGAVALGAAMGVPNSLSHMHADVFRGGKISGNTGAGGVKTPFIVIERPQVATPDNYTQVMGIGACVVGTLRGASGFVRVQNIDLKSRATDAEKREIEELLAKGIYLN